MDNPSTDMSVDVEQNHDGQSLNRSENSVVINESGNGNVSISPAESQIPSQSNSHRSAIEGNNRHRRRHHRHRHHRHGRRSGEIRYEKTLLHFSAVHILLGIICVLIQVKREVVSCKLSF